MDALDRKIIDAFPGKIVRKDLTALMKKGANVPTYVLEYLLGIYCSSDDEEIIASGMEKIKKILSENYVRPDQSEYIKSKIRENGRYTIIDKVTVELNEREDIYVARFTNLKISPFKVSPDLVLNNDKLLTGGLWCIMKIDYVGLDPEDENEEQDEEVDIFGNKLKKKKKKKKSKFSSPFEIVSLRPIQMPSMNIEEIFEERKNFTSEEWKDLLLRSLGYEPNVLSDIQKLHYLLRVVPFIQKNYNLVELGPRGTGKSHVYSEISPYSILMSSGHTTVANMFYNIGLRRVGLVGNWDCVAFDEVGGIKNASNELVQMLKNYMANGTFARGTDSIGADASIAFEGNTFRSVEDMIRTTNLFEPFPEEFNNDSAFFDRIHSYLPGWETPKLRASLFTDRFGFITDFFAEFCHQMRSYDFTSSYKEYFELNKNFNKRDDIGVSRTFSGLAKLIYPDGIMTKEEIRELLEYSIQGRRRVKEQLRKMNPAEFSDVALGYIDLETGEEIIIRLPEVANESLVYEGYEKPGYVYAIGNSKKGKIGIYRLENKLLEGRGEFKFKNVEGISSFGSKSLKDSLVASFNYFYNNIDYISKDDYRLYDYALFYNDLQNRGSSEELSVAEVVGLFSAITRKPVLPSLVICGRLVMSGSVLPVNGDLEDIIVAAANAGAKRIMLPENSRNKYEKVREDLKEEIEVIFYDTPLDASRKAIGVY